MIEMHHDVIGQVVAHDPGAAVATTEGIDLQLEPLGYSALVILQARCRRERMDGATVQRSETVAVRAIGGRCQRAVRKKYQMSVVDRPAHVV